VITEKDLQEAIAECQGQRNPNANTCIKLAAYYIIKNEMFGNTEQVKEPEYQPEIPSYSYAPAPEPIENIIDYDSGTEFSDAIRGREQGEIWAIMDELMDVLQATNTRLYNGVMRKIADN
jgi:hypothetical protein